MTGKSRSGGGYVIPGLKKQIGDNFVVGDNFFIDGVMVLTCIMAVGVDLSAGSRVVAPL